MWTGLSAEESVRMTEDRDKWRKYVHGVANPRIEDGYRTEATETFTPCSNIKGDTNLIAVILLSNLNRFLKFLNRQILRVICNEAIIKDPTTFPDVVLPDSSPSNCVTKKGNDMGRPKPCCLHTICNISSAQFNCILLIAKGVETATCTEVKCTSWQ